jgi:serine protease Do
MLGGTPDVSIRRFPHSKERTMQSTIFKRSAWALALVGALGLGVGIADRVPFSHAHAAANPVGAGSVAAPAPSPVAALPDFSDLAARQGPAVVNISVTMKADRGDGWQRRAPDLDDLPPFFRNFPMPVPPRQGPSRGVGSGFIISPDGVILTNAHVVADADDVTVKLTDRREFKAKVLGTDRTTDVAVLRIDARNLPYVKTGDPDKIRVGEWVVAIGQPYGFENTVTSGIVSAKYRSLPGDSYVPFIQTDAAVNPGNSGGPLFNLRGEVIGINSQIFSRSGGNQGLAFAIPIDVAMHVKDQIQQYGKVSHGRLGVTIQEVNQALASSFGLRAASGALVSSVQKGEPAAKAGIEPGDVILRFDGKEIGSSGDLPPLVAAMQPGSTATLDVWHDGRERELKVTVGTLEDKTNVASGSPETGDDKLGVAVRPLSPEERKSAEVANGVVVEDVAGAAARAGVRPGDIIVAVNNTPVRSASQLRELLAKSGKSVALLVQRDDARIFIPVTVG